MPAGWAGEEPFYSMTAGGTQANHPTMQITRTADGAFSVTLNRRQWDAMLGPCEEAASGLLCREASDVLEDQTAYEMIRNSLNGDSPRRMAGCLSGAVGSSRIGRWVFEWA
ncbi:hypothetical protein OO25_08085 [Phaeobacter sp. S60]|nr:hypothetical protein OO25_08085 [Phaeobacter sp. S60]